jgi:hypothetical protein
MSLAVIRLDANIALAGRPVSGLGGADKHGFAGNSGFSRILPGFLQDVDVGRGFRE